MSTEGPNEPQQSTYQQLMRLAAAGTQLAAMIGGSAVLGWFLDEHFDTRPWLLLAFILLGSVGGFLQFVRTIRILNDPGRNG